MLASDRKANRRETIRNGFYMGLGFAGAALVVALGARALNLGVRP